MQVNVVPENRALYFLCISFLQPNIIKWTILIVLHCIMLALFRVLCLLRSYNISKKTCHYVKFNGEQSSALKMIETELEFCYIFIIIYV